MVTQEEKQVLWGGGDMRHTPKIETMKQDLDEIHESLVNGQRRQAVEQIKAYGLYDFFADYRDFCKAFYDKNLGFTYFTDATVSYHRITNR